MRTFLLTACAAFLLGGCSARPSSVDGLIVAGALTGGIIGAGAGAGIGAIIHNGSVARSALLGAGVGVAAGALFSGGGQNVALNTTINQRQAQIERNKRQIAAQEREIQSLRDELDYDSKSIELDPQRRSTVYDGPTVGLYYR